MNLANATPHATLLAELMNPNNPKNEREHAAVREIERLQEALAQPEQKRQWLWLSDADIAEVIDTTCQYEGSYEAFLIKKAERKSRSMNNGA